MTPKGLHLQLRLPRLKYSHSWGLYHHIGTLLWSALPLRRFSWFTTLFQIFIRNSMPFSIIKAAYDATYSISQILIRVCRLVGYHWSCRNPYILGAVRVHVLGISTTFRIHKGGRESTFTMMLFTVNSCLTMLSYASKLPLWLFDPTPNSVDLRLFGGVWLTSLAGIYH